MVQLSHREPPLQGQCAAGARMVVREESASQRSLGGGGIQGGWAGWHPDANTGCWELAQQDPCPPGEAPGGTVAGAQQAQQHGGAKCMGTCCYGNTPRHRPMLLAPLGPPTKHSKHPGKPGAVSSNRLMMKQSYKERGTQLPTLLLPKAAQGLPTGDPICDRGMHDNHERETDIRRDSGTSIPEEKHLSFQQDHCVV